MPRKKHLKWDGWNSVLWIVLALALLFVFSPFISFLLHGGEVGDTRVASCQSNMKQLGLALLQYSQDNNQMMPSGAAADGHGWREAVFPYVKFTGVYHCPDDESSSGNGLVNNIPKSYAANHILLPHPYTWSTFAKSALTISLVDTRGNDGEDWNMTSPAFLPGSGRELFAHLPRHLFYEHPAGSLNLLFADGHVKAMKPAATLTPVNLWTVNNKPFAGQDLVNAQAILKHAEDV